MALRSAIERIVDVLQLREDGNIGQESTTAQIQALDQATLSATTFMIMLSLASSLFLTLER